MTKTMLHPLTKDEIFVERIAKLEAFTESHKELFLSMMAAQEKAVDLARDMMTVRLEGMNEFRESMQRMEGTFVTRKEMDLALDKHSSDIRVLNTMKDKMEVKADINAVYIAYVLSSIGVILSAISMFQRKNWTATRRVE